jgi:hypothetical protein
MRVSDPREGDASGIAGNVRAFDEVCFRLVLLAQQRGLVDESFFDRLVEERPGQAGRIRAVAARWLDEQHALPSRETRPLDANALPALPTEYVPEPAPLPPGSRMHMRRNPQFVGRTEQLRAIARALQVNGRAAIGQVASVTGLGGIGKTQLAAELVYRYGQFFHGGVFWLSFNENAPDIATQVDRVRNVFTGPEPRLLVFDNCEDEALLKDWLPASGCCRVLVTSRRAAFSAHLVGHIVPLDVLPRPDSLSLLRLLMRGQASGVASEATLDAICAELAQLPQFSARWDFFRGCAGCKWA